MRAFRARRAGLRPKSLIFHRCLRQAHRIAAANEGNPDTDAQRLGKLWAADSQQSTDQSIDVASQASGGGGSMPVSIVKSGVVNGMAYILYSDGSIEAQLPQGTLRFGSITELRNHIEHSA